MPALTPADTAASDALSGSPLLGHTLMGLGRSWRKLLDQRLAALGQTDASWVPLFHLDAAGDGISLKALAQHMGLDSSTLVRSVDVLESRGWLQRVTDPVDRRSKQLWLTEAGRRAVAALRQQLAQVDAELLQGLERSSVQALHAGMAQLAEHLARLQAASAAGHPHEDIA
jgi:MarR family transcriptional regulator for hemolysin